MAGRMRGMAVRCMCHSTHGAASSGAAAVGLQLYATHTRRQLQRVSVVLALLLQRVA